MSERQWIEQLRIAIAATIDCSWLSAFVAYASVKRELSHSVRMLFENNQLAFETSNVKRSTARISAESQCEPEISFVIKKTIELSTFCDWERNARTYNRENGQRTGINVQMQRGKWLPKYRINYRYHGTSMNVPDLWGVSKWLTVVVLL